MNDPFKSNRDYFGRMKADADRRTDLLHLTNAIGINKQSWAVMIEDNSRTAQFKNKVIIYFN